MTTPIVLGILLMLPAFALLSKLNTDRERAQKIHDFEAFTNAIDKVRERAVITTGIIPALRASAHIERLLEANKELASGFGIFARNVVYLAKLYLAQGECCFDTTLMDTICKSNIQRKELETTSNSNGTLSLKNAPCKKLLQS